MGRLRISDSGRKATPWGRNRPKRRVYTDCGSVPTDQNRRRALRVRSINLVAYAGKRRERQKTSISMGKTLDLSQSGVRIQVSTGLEEGDLLEIEIGAGEELIQAEARVVHVELVEGGFFEVGAEFTNLADQDRAVLLSLLG